MCGDPYITYIEKRYLEKCKRIGNSANIQSDWQSKKLLYREMTKTTIYEFMNYSMHDESHSIHILESIEMLLGKNRIDKLSRSDLWLLLNAAYAHDIGMVTEYKDLESLWSDLEFREYLKEAKDSLDRNDANAARQFELLDGFLKGNITYEDQNNEIDFSYGMHDSWPLEFRKDITLLMSNFIRKKHGELSRKFFETPEKTNNYIIEDRLYRLIGVIAACHTDGQESLEQIPVVCKGFGTDQMHPRFAAMLLRLGDLLDLDNNRFDIFSLRHFGPLPQISVSNYKKHKSITHFHIDPRIVEVTAKSENFEECKLNQIWFQYLQNDIEYLITHWSIMAPEKLKGCLLGLPDLQVIHGKSEFTDDSMTEFVLEKQKLLTLFTGNNLYSSDLDFIREYMQNAFDASKLQLYYELLPIEKNSSGITVSSKAELYLKNEEIELKNLKPFDLKKMAYEAYGIIVTIKPDPDDMKRFILQITDKGIGIDKEGLNAITDVGSGWKKRPNHKKVISQMREWLRPTGGFGIGLQSAFLITDEVRLYTKPPFETGRCITLSKYSNKKNVFVEIDRNNICRGTTAEFRIFYEKLQQTYIIKKYLPQGIDKFDVFSQKGKLQLVYQIIKQYLKDTFPMSLFPIKMQLSDGISDQVLIRETVLSPYLCQMKTELPEIPAFSHCMKDDAENSNGKNQQDNNSAENELVSFIREHHKTPERIYYYLEDKILRIWDDVPEILYCFSIPQELESVTVSANYKNVLVKDDTKKIRRSDTKHPEFIEIAFDVMGLTVEDCLIVSRNAFRKGALSRGKILTDLFIRAYAHMLVKSSAIKVESIPNDILLFSCLIEADRALVQKAVNTSGSILESIEYDFWTFLKDNDMNWKLEKRFISPATVLRELDTSLWMAEVGNPEEINGKVEYQCIKYKESIALSRKDSSIDSMKRTLPENAKILCDRKIYAVLSKYRKNDPDILIDFYDTLTKQPMKAYVINNGLQEVMNWQEKKTSGSPMEKSNPEPECPQFRRTYTAQINPDNHEFAPLLVKKVPFGVTDSGVYYIISPYTEEIGMQIENQPTSMNTVKIKQLIAQIEKTPSYEELCQWVYQNQKEKNKYTILQIKEAYSKFIRKDLKSRKIGG